MVELTETTIAVLVATGAVLAMTIVAVRALRAHTRRRFDAMLGRVDDHLASISDSLRDALDRSDAVKANAVREHELTRDGLTNAHQRHGYEAELEREVLRARTSQRPLSLIVLDVHDLAAPHEIEQVAADLAELLARVTRTSDKVVRSRDDELVVLLPETSAEAAWRFHGRLRTELAKSFDHPVEKLTVLTDVVEWRPDETSKSFDARARQAAGRGGMPPLGRHADGLDLPNAG